MSKIKIFFWLSLPLLAQVLIGCTTVRYYPVNFVESLQHPTKFPEVFSSNVQNIEELAEKNPLGADEDVKITDVGENKNSSMHLIQVRENGELRPHYHKRHDEVIYVKKGSGIATLDGTRYLVKPGSILQVPGKTVHKFLNTGGEPFMAVSIISPPFDGRDEKTIKEKKKAGRGVKGEKRLAAKKPEKIPERKQAGAGEELSDEEIGESAVESERVADKKIDAPVRNEGKSDAEKSSLPQKKISSGAGRKRSKVALSGEEPIIDIEEMHRKLARLLELKEEGTISDEEYEEKKDALVEGRDIGDLPELKGTAKKKIPIEDELAVTREEKRLPTDKEISDENRNIMASVQGLSDGRESTINESDTEDAVSSSEDRLKVLEEMRQEDLITEEDYEVKKRELLGSGEEETASLPSENSRKDERIEELKELYNQELITEEDYTQKLKELTDAQARGSSAESSSGEGKNNLEDERIGELKELYDQGLITEEDYEYKLKELTNAQTQPLSPVISPEKGVEDDKVSELRELKEQGLITEEDYEFKKEQLLSK